MIRTFILLLIGLTDAAVIVAVFFAYIIPIKYLGRKNGLPAIMINPDGVRVTWLFLGLGTLLCVISYFLARYLKKVDPPLFRRLLVIPGFALVLMLIRLVYVLIVV